MKWPGSRCSIAYREPHCVDWKGGRERRGWQEAVTRSAHLIICLTHCRPTSEQFLLSALGGFQHPAPLAFDATSRQRGRAYLLQPERRLACVGPLGGRQRQVRVGLSAEPADSWVAVFCVVRAARHKSRR